MGIVYRQYLGDVNHYRCSPDVEARIQRQCSPCALLGEQDAQVLPVMSCGSSRKSVGRENQVYICGGFVLSRMFATNKAVLHY